MYRHDEPNEPFKEGPLSFVLHKSPFGSVSRVVSRGHPSLGSPNGLDVKVGVNRNRPLLTHCVVGDTTHRLHHVSTLLVTGEE